MSKDLGQQHQQPQSQAYLYATAVPINPINPTNNEAPEHVVKCYQLSKTVMLFAMIDIFFGLFYMFYSFLYLIPLIIAVYGYYSAKRYNSTGVLTYTIYQVLVNILRLAFSIYAYVLVRQDPSITNYTPYNLYIVLAILTTTLGLYIARFCYKLYKSITELSNSDRERLILLNYPIRVVYW